MASPSRVLPGRSVRAAAGPDRRGRLSGFALALLAEGLLVLLLLTLSPADPPPRVRERPNTFSLSPDTPPDTPPAPERPPEPETPQPAARPAEPQPPQPEAADPAPPRPSPPAPPAAVAPPPAIVQVAPGQFAAADLAAVSRTAPPAPARRVYGPPNVRSGPADTPRVEGSGPNGEPLYAAAWYREPYPDELRGYLSTARGPGWALIACRTVKDFRVEDCVGLSEYPDRSGMIRAVLAAAWQFRVRPPLRGGQYMVGDWVRIRIDYERRGS